MAIELPPSSNVDALANAIQQATTSGEPLVLLPGVHLTKPGIKPVTPIGPNGLVMAGSNSGPLTFATIQRPKFSVGNNPQHKTDDNYGIFFIPSHPTRPELKNLQFHFHPPAPPVNIPFEFAIIQRGDIKIGDIHLDCNMGQQNLKPKSAQHSFMLGFSGASYRLTPGPNKLERRAFVSFNSVTLRNIRLLNGGFADDIRIEPGFDSNPPGFFRPNIGLVEMTQITTGLRVNGEGNSIRFGGLAQRVAVNNCDIDSLILEFDEDWSTFPGPPGPFQPSQWNVAGVKARTIAFNAVGSVQTLEAANLDARASFTVSNAAGQIFGGSRLTFAPNDVQLANLRQFLFQNCVFTLPQKAGIVNGIDLITKPGKTCSARFRGCEFTTAGAVQKGHLILSESTKDPANQVTADFENCRYDPALAPNADILVANLALRGDYTFLKSDFAGLDITTAIKFPKTGQMINQGATALVHIP
ncbi:MAG TPA: hypothetical protein VH639_04665 [Bryobacteraceae bacterium]